MIQVKVKVTQSCPILCDPMDYTVHGILQARIMEWVPSPAHLPDPGIEPGSPKWQANSLPTELLTRSAQCNLKGLYKQKMEAAESASE